MAHLLRGKQAGVQGDLSAGITPDALKIDDIARMGINSQISTIAYDPVQSLLAVGTNQTKFGKGQIYIFGQKRVNVVLDLRREASVRDLHFCAEKLICLDSKNELSVYSLDTKALLSSYSPPGTPTAIHSDPTLDYVFIGTSNGEVMAYDLDRERMAPFRLPNFLKDQNPRLRVSPIVSIQLHPRDIGKLLIGYQDGAVIYNFKAAKPQQYFQYQLPRGAPGGDSDPSAINRERVPNLTHAVWHPTGTFIMTAHEDSSMVFWDPNTGKIVQARTLQDTNVDKPGSGASNNGSAPGTFALKEPFFKIAWCANKDPDDTAILVSGGSSTTIPTKGLTLLELARTPNYTTSSYQILSDHFENPKRQRILPLPPDAEVVDFCLIPRNTPHFAGAHDPIAVVALLSSGELITLSFPSGLPITPINQLHPSLSFIHPFMSSFSLSPIERVRWLGMTEKRAHGPSILTGGASAVRPKKRFENRNILQTSHTDGTIRLWDAGHGDDIENEAMLQIDVSRAVGRWDNVDVVKMSLSGANGEFAAGLRSGELVVFRWLVNKTPGQEPSQPPPNSPKQLTNIMERRDPAVSEGLLPFTLFDPQNGPVSALKLSDVGFVAAGFEGGQFCVIDLRGPAIIYSANTADFAKEEKKGGFRRSSQKDAPRKDWPTSIEFSVMTAEDDGFSSILVHVGTHLGHIATFKVLPDGPRFNVQFAGSVALDDPVIYLHPLKTDTGRPAYASQSAVANLRSGSKVNGVIVAVSQNGVKIFRPATSKGASKSWDDALCDSAFVCRFEDAASALVGLFGDGCVRVYSLPGLKEISSTRVHQKLDARRFAHAQMTSTGDIVGWNGPSELALINIWGAGLDLTLSKDILFNPERLIPPRPTISSFQWVSGTQMVTPSDMDILIGGPDRPPSKRMMQQARDDEMQRRVENRAGQRAGASSSVQDEGYFAYLQRQINERTENLQIMGDSMDRLENNSQNWADDVNKFVNKQKRNMFMGAVKGKFFG